MKTHGSVFAVFCVLTVCSAAFAAESPDFDHYRSILVRQMFGAVPPGFDPANPSGNKDLPQGLKPDELAREQSKLASTVQMHTFMHTPEGVLKIGFSDNSAKPPKNYLLTEGEERDGWLVSSVVASEQSAVIEKNGIAVKISMSAPPVPADASGRQKHDASSMKNANTRENVPGNDIRERRRRHFGGGQFKEKLAERQMRAAEMEEKRKAEEAAREAERNAMRESLMMVADEIKQMREAEAMRRDEEEELRRRKEAEDTPIQIREEEDRPQENVQ